MGLAKPRGLEVRRPADIVLKHMGDGLDRRYAAGGGWCRVVSSDRFRDPAMQQRARARDAPWPHAEDMRALHVAPFNGRCGDRKGKSRVAGHAGDAEGAYRAMHVGGDDGGDDGRRQGNAERKPRRHQRARENVAFQASRWRYRWCLPGAGEPGPKRAVGAGGERAALHQHGHGRN